MWHAIPVEDFLLLLRPDTIVLVHKIEERALRLLEGGVGAGFEVPQIREDAFLEFLGVLHRPTEGLKAK